ncbi:HAD-IA family hydrolase [Methanosarcina sp. DH1]|uniref:HAD family hydrolase n=1 Tax=Methanosarcina sp. DH1 TaxID=2605695 RepID=UPI001E445135|nr:HAD-IA family hydrolase [Methanosarcina sp. DH1]MCC4767505.1 HAD-IA family hydrolase [Methanosarcina sp. DH1]
MQKKYLLWDFDNTLAYRDGMWGQTIYDLLQEHGYGSIKLEDIRPLLTRGFPWHTPEISHEEFLGGVQWWDYMTLHFSKIIHEIGVNETLSAEIAGQIKMKYLDIEKWHLYDDTIPCLERAVSKGYENIIVSNHVPELSILVRDLGISDYFFQVYSSAQIGYEKPNIQIYRRVLEKLEDTSEVTMIGDSYIADVEGAINAGIKAILVRKENIHNYQNYCKSLDEIDAILL